MRYSIWLTALLLLPPAFAPAQTPAYLHYGVQEGLPSNLVYCGKQDHLGLLWFGTDKGLACFDGTRFRTLGMKDGLPDPEVLNLLEDSDGRLWISSHLKKPCYRQHGRFVTERQDSMLAKMEAHSALWEFFEDADSSVWLSGQTDLVARFSKNHIENYRISKGIVRAGRIDGMLFFFGIGHIFQPQADGNMKIVGSLDAPPRRDVNPFRGLSISGSRVLYSFVDKLVLLEWRDGQFREIARRDSPLGRVFTDNEGRFWVCSLAEGAVCFNNKRRDLSNPVHYFKGEKVTSMFDDRQGTHWFCTTDNGVYALPKNVAVNFTERSGLLSNNLTALARSPGGQLWAGDDEGNLYELGQGHDLRIIPFGSVDGYNRIRRIIPAPDGGLWLVTDEALYYENGQFRQKIEAFVSPKTAVLQDDTLWFASSGGLEYVLRKTFAWNRLKLGRFAALGNDWEKNVWAGSNEGVFCSKDNFQFNWGQHFAALKGRIVAIERAGKDSLWVVTPEKGLLLAMVKAGAITSVQTINDRLAVPIENIQSLFSAPNGYLWLATNRGAYRLDKNLNVIHFDRHDGMADNDVNAVLVHGDTVWAATVGGLSRLALKTPDVRGDFPTLAVRARYRVGSEMRDFHLLDSLAAEKRIVLPPDASLFEIELAGLDYRSRGNFRYECVTASVLPSWRRWTLDNLLMWVGNGFKEKADTTWAGNGILSFGVRLPPGNYRLTITAVTTGGVRSLQPDVWSVEMRPYRYSIIWFTLLLWSLAAYAVWRFLRARSAFRRLDAAVSELQLQALHTQMNPHFIGNSINAIQQFFYPPDPVRASQYIALFTRLLRRTLSFSEQTFIPFSEELAYDRDYLEMVKLRFGDRFHFEVTGAENVPEETPFPSMLLQPILENATVHGFAPEGLSMLHLDFSFSGKKLICTITDNGAGLRKTRERQKAAGTTRTSRGLEMLRQKVETLNRRFNLGLKLDLQNLSDTAPALRGTRAVIRFFPQNATPPKTRGQSAPYS